MTLSTEQCIEIAEKIWLMPEEELVYKSEVLHEGIPVINVVVNSWQGFGRTVEAMAMRGKPLEIELTGSRKWPELSAERAKRVCQGMITKTHLNALEAIKEKE